MNPRRLAKRFSGAMLWLFVLSFAPAGAKAVVVTTARQRSLEQWRHLTSPIAEAPRVFVKGNHIRFYFQSETNVIGFHASWSPLRVPADGYAVSSGLLHWDKNLSQLPEAGQRWREVTVIAGAAWRRLATKLVESLTPKSPWHGAYYQAFLADRVLYRDAQGHAHLAPQGEQPGQVIIDHRFPLEETLQVLAERTEEYRAQRHPDETLFLLMAPNGNRLSQPLLVDRQHRQCVSLLPAALFDLEDRGLGFAATAQGLGAALQRHSLADRQSVVEGKSVDL